MDLSTTYMGLKLRTPLVPSASPLSKNLDTIKKMEDAGASAVVMYSLFEEQIKADSLELHHHLTEGTESFPEALSYFPDAGEYNLGPDEYLSHISKAKQSVKIPIIGSLNGTTAGGWTDYARQIEQAGADALELNIYYIPTQKDLASEKIEQMYVEALKHVKSAIRIPVAVKLGPFFSNVANMAGRLEAAGADGFVLFNRFYQPDINLEKLEIEPNILLSSPQEMRLPLRWIAILHGHVKTSLAATSGIYKPEDVLKMLLVGADITMLCSVLLQSGPERIRKIEEGLVKLMEVNEYESVGQLKGSMSQKKCPNPTAYERALYIKALSGYRPE